MHIVAIHDWPQEVSEAAAAIATALGILVFEARQKIAGGGPVVIASYADQSQAESTVARLFEHGIPAFVIGCQAVQSGKQSYPVARFVLGEQAMQLGLISGEQLEIGYGRIELLLVASSCLGQTQTSSSLTERKFSLGKTLLAGGIPMTKKVKSEGTLTSEERDQTLWLYTSDQKIWIFNRTALNYTGLGDALQLSRELNFNYLKNELRQRAPQANYDERLLRRGDLIRVLGPRLSPESDLDLAFEVLARCLRVKHEGE